MSFVLNQFVEISELARADQISGSYLSIIKLKILICEGQNDHQIGTTGQSVVQTHLHNKSLDLLD